MTYSNERTVQFPGSEGRDHRGSGATSEESRSQGGPKVARRAKPSDQGDRARHSG